MKKLTRIAVAGALAAAMIGGAVLTAAAAKEIRPIAPIRPRPIVVLPVKELPKQQFPLLADGGAAAGALQVDLGTAITVLEACAAVENQGKLLEEDIYTAHAQLNEVRALANEVNDLRRMKDAADH